MYVNSRLKAIQIIGKRKGREFQSLPVLRNNNRKTIQIYQNNEKTSFENKEVESFAPVHINICQSHNQLIVWFASAAHSNLDSKNLTFLGLKNDVQITAVMNNFLLKPRSRNLFKCFFFLSSGTSRGYIESISIISRCSSFNITPSFQILQKCFWSWQKRHGRYTILLQIQQTLCQTLNNITRFVATMEHYYKPTENPILKNFQFRSLTQHRGETFLSFCNRLWKEAIYCHLS